MRHYWSQQNRLPIWGKSVEVSHFISLKAEGGILQGREWYPRGWHPNPDREEKRREKFSRAWKGKTEKRWPPQEESLAKEWPSSRWSQHPLGFSIGWNQQETGGLEETLDAVYEATAVAEGRVEESGEGSSGTQGRQLVDRPNWVQLEGSADVPRQYRTLPKVMCEAVIHNFLKKWMKHNYSAFKLLTILEEIKGLKFGNRKEDTSQDVCVPYDWGWGSINPSPQARGNRFWKASSERLICAPSVWGDTAVWANVSLLRAKNM